MFVLDESSYRIDKTAFADAEEAEDRAAESARILGRAINIYQLQGGALDYYGRVLPDGTVDRGPNPLTDPAPGPVPAAWPVVLGHFLDDAAAEAEKASNLQLSAKLDLLHAALTAHGVVATENPKPMTAGQKGSVFDQLADMLKNLATSEEKDG